MAGEPTVKALPTGERGILPTQYVPLRGVTQLCHLDRATCHWGCAGTLERAQLYLQRLWGAALATNAAWVSVLLWGRGFAPFLKHLRGSWQVAALPAPSPRRVTGQPGCSVTSQRGRGMVQILPVQSRQAITREEMVPLLLFFFPVAAPSIFLKGKMQIC